MKDFNFTTNLTLRKDLSSPCLRAVVMALLVVLGVGNAWASDSYKAELTVTTESTGAGLVYAYHNNTAPANDQYLETSKANDNSSSKGSTVTYYMWAKPKRGSVFASWEKTSGTLNSGPSGGAQNGSVKITKPSSDGTTKATVRANWTTYSKADVTFHTPKDGSYEVRYGYYDYQDGAFTTVEENDVMTEDDDPITKESYQTDTITLKTTATNFEGWYSNNDWAEAHKLSTSKTYTYSAPNGGTADVYAKFTETKKFYGKLTAKLAPSSAADGGSLYLSKFSTMEGAVFSMEDRELVQAANAASNDDSSMEQTFYIHAKATDSRYKFRGWFSDEACTKLVSADLDYTKVLTVTSESSSAPTETTIYAFFERACAHYLQVDVLPATTGWGMVNAHDIKYTDFPNYTEFENISSQTVIVHSTNTTTNGTVYLYAQPKYGYKFTGWYTDAACTGSAVSTANPYTYSTPAASTDPLLPTKRVFYAKFEIDATFNVTYNLPSNGQYTASVLDIVNDNGNYVWGQTQVYTSEGKTAPTAVTHYKTDYLTLSATPDAGYKVTKWTDGSDVTTASWEYKTKVSAAKTVGVTFATTEPYKVGNNKYTTLDAAITAAGSNGTIIVVEDAYVPAGTYTIPSGVTLLVPFDDAYTCYTTAPGSTYSGKVTTGAYKMLTLGDGCNLIVNGAISVSAKQYGTQPYGGCVTGLHGRIHMKGNAKITLKSGANLYCWGYITGDNDKATGIQAGQVIAEDGSKVYEGFQITCWRGGSAATSSVFSNYKVFPLIQYYIQNVEVPMTLYKGAVENVYTGVTASSDVYNGSTALIGTTSGMFQLVSGKITKWYNAVIDKQMYKIEGTTKLEAIELQIKSIPLVGTVNINSNNYVLPLNNMDIQIASGTMTCSQRIAVIPGSSITIDKGASVVFDGNSELYVYDKDQWPNDGAAAYSYSNVAFKPVPYTPTGITTKRTYANMKDGQLNINGSFETQSGHLYTTSGGADIYSGNQTGKIIYTKAAGTNSLTYQATQSGTTMTKVNIPITAATLHNWDDTYRETVGSGNNTTFYNIRGLWMQLTQDGCFYKDPQNHLFVLTNNEFYEVIASPSYTAAYQATDCPDLVYIHTANNCDWVPTHTVADNATLLKGMDDKYWQYSEAKGYWEEAPSFTVTFKNFNETVLETATIYNNGTPAYTGYTPVRASDDNGEYTFTGWSPVIGAVTADATYTAQYSCAPYAASVTAYGLTQYYTTIQDAVTAANGKTGAMVKLLQDITITSEIALTATMTVDLNDHTIKSTQAAATGVFKINASGKTVTIKDSGTGGKIDHTASYNGKMYGVWLTAGSLKIEGGTIYAENKAAASNDYRAYGIWTDGSASSITMSNGTIEATSKNMAFGIYCGNSCAITMTGGEISSHGTTSIRGIYTQGTTILTDATITSTATSTDSRTFFIKPGTNMTINSGTYTATGATGAVYVVYQQNGTVTINGGRFSATDIEFLKDAGTTTIKGGMYKHNTNLATNCPANYYVLPLTNEAPYNYKVAEAYTVTFNNYDGTQLQSGLVEKNVIPACDGTPTHPSDDQYDYIFTGWDAELVPVTANATYTATFNDHTIRSYSIRWENIDGSEIRTDTMDYGTQPSFEGAPTYSDETGKLYVFRAWKHKSTGIEYTLDEVFPEVGGAETYIAQYYVINNLDVASEQTISVNAEVEVTTVHVEGRLMVSSGSLTTNELILEGTPTSSGEIIGNVDVTQNAYFDFSQPDGFKAKTWYAVAVPWQVDVPANELGSVYTKKGTGDYVQQRLGRTYDLIYYNGARRATGVNKAWNYVEEDPAAEHIMVPGRAYMIYLTSDADMIRFKKSASAELHTDTVAVVKHSSDKGAIYADWNGIANPATYKAKLDVGTTDDKGQVYNPETKGYEWFYLNSQQLQVGQPVFVQPIEQKIVEAERVNPSSPAPRRSAEWSAPLSRYEINLALTDEEVSDRIIVRMDEEKEEDAYIVGQDLVKMGVSNLVPQMWINRYDSKMSINTMAPVNNTADYPLGISVQKDGEYDLFIADQPEDNSTLYLTYDGMAIWNLSYGGYVAYLNKGTDTHYGLRIVKKTRPIVTGIEDATIQNGDAIRKVIVEDKVFIIRNGEIYSVDGQMVK